MARAWFKLSAPPTGEAWTVTVLWEDEHLLAVDKPGRLLTSPDRDDPARPSLMRLLHEGIRAEAGWSRERQLGYLANAHRLDYEATGVLLLAKTKPVLVDLANQFGNALPIQCCVALVQGTPDREEFEIDARLAPHPAKPGCVVVDRRRGKPSVTRVKVLERFRGFALVEACPINHRTHQVRAHLRHVGLPLAGDEPYGGRPLLLSRLKKDYHLKPHQVERPLIGCAALHAAELRLRHPVSGAEVVIAAPWPKDLTVAVKYLRRFALPTAVPANSAPPFPGAV
jgi:RluA family pseudouridine synthase